MEWYVTFLMILGPLFFLMMLGLPVAFAFLAVNLVGSYILMGGVAGIEQLVLNTVDSVSSFTLIPIALFMIMGEAMFRSGIAIDLMDTLDKWFGKLRGRLALMAVGGGVLFSTLTGNSMGSIALLGSSLTPEMEKRGYAKPMSLGPILGSSGLAIMIPPSSLAVVLGVIAEISIGKADAKITIIEYASMSCGHCGFFHRELLPKLKSKYIDTGVARLVVREFPLNYAAAAVSMLARCAGSEKTYEVISTMFDRQQQWLKRGDVRDDLRGIMSEFGMSEETFKRCLVNKELFHQIKTVRERAIDAFGVKSTPTFFINAKKLNGNHPMSSFRTQIDGLLSQPQSS